MAYDVAQDLNLAAKYFQDSYQAFSKAGCKLKASRAFQNALACQTSTQPISISLQRLRAYWVSLKFANRAISVLKREAGTLHFYLAIAHRSHLFIDLQQIHAATRDLLPCQTVHEQL